MQRKLQKAENSLKSERKETERLKDELNTMERTYQHLTKERSQEFERSLEEA